MLHKVIWEIYEIYFTSETKGTVNYPDKTTQSNAFLTCGFIACPLLTPSIRFRAYHSKEVYFSKFKLLEFHKIVTEK